MISNDAETTIRIGEIIGQVLQPGDIVGLIGELGAGKTCLTQGIARGLGVPAGLRVTSPTFTLINEYPGRAPLVHIDTYRLSGSRDLGEMGYEDYFFGKNVVVVEWAEKIMDLLPETSIFIRLEYIDEDSRRIEISGDRNKVDLIMNALQEGGFQ